MPGNAGTASFARNIEASSFRSLVLFSRREKIDFTVVGPDDLLKRGVVDYFRKHGLHIFGPTKKAARIETSKVFAKKFMRRHGIETAPFRVFLSIPQALAYLRNHPTPVVLKPDGLTRGKGVEVCETIEHAKHKAFSLLRNNKNEIVIEEYLPGEEVSLHHFVSNGVAISFPPSQDHKKFKGKMTGGMGTIAPVPWFTEEMQTASWEEIVAPVAANLPSFSGCLYSGLIVEGGKRSVLEFNARFGDPEAQVYMRLLKSDLLPLLEACADGKLTQVPSPLWHDGYACCVVLVSQGYPGPYLLDGAHIRGLEEAEKIPGVVIFHAGTRAEHGAVYTKGGRVLNVTATGVTLQEALSRAYLAVRHIQFAGMEYRSDIGAKYLTAPV